MMQNVNVWTKADGSQHNYIPKPELTYYLLLLLNLTQVQ